MLDTSQQIQMLSLVRTVTRLIADMQEEKLVLSSCSLHSHTVKRLPSYSAVRSTGDERALAFLHPVLERLNSGGGCASSSSAFNRNWAHGHGPGCDLRGRHVI